MLVWRRAAEGPQFLLGHHGGPFWAGRNEGAWTIPKGLIEADEADEVAARREFLEETGLAVEATLARLTPVRASGKVLLIWLAEADPDLAAFSSNVFEVEWPPRSGRTRSYPELDRIAWWSAADALRLIGKGQRPILQEAIGRLG